MKNEVVFIKIGNVEVRENGEEKDYVIRGEVLGGSNLEEAFGIRPGEEAEFVLPHWIMKDVPSGLSGLNILRERHEKALAAMEQNLKEAREGGDEDEIRVFEKKLAQMKEKAAESVIQLTAFEYVDKKGVKHRVARYTNIGRDSLDPRHDNIRVFHGMEGSFRVTIFGDQRTWSMPLAELFRRDSDNSGPSGELYVYESVPGRRGSEGKWIRREELGKVATKDNVHFSGHLFRFGSPEDSSVLEGGEGISADDVLGRIREFAEAEPGRNRVKLRELGPDGAVLRQITLTRFGSDTWDDRIRGVWENSEGKQDEQGNKIGSFYLMVQDLIQGLPEGARIDITAANEVRLSRKSAETFGQKVVEGLNGVGKTLQVLRRDFGIYGPVGKQERPQNYCLGVCASGTVAEPREAEGENGRAYGRTLFLFRVPYIGAQAVSVTPAPSADNRAEAKAEASAPAGDAGESEADAINDDIPVPGFDPDDDIPF